MLKCSSTPEHHHLGGRAAKSRRPGGRGFPAEPRPFEFVPLDGLTGRGMTDALSYQTGFGSHFASEAVPGALPQGRNSPQRPAFGLYAEQLSGTAFTAPRAENRRSWLYRMRPSAAHRLIGATRRAAVRAGHGDAPLPPNRLRWDPLAMPDGRRLRRRPGHDDGQSRSRRPRGRRRPCLPRHADMGGRYFFDADGELLIIPEQGRLASRTELGGSTSRPARSR